MIDAANIRHQTEMQNPQSVRESSFPTPPCRFCGASLKTTFVDLGMSPLCESFLAAGQLNQMERFYPLHVYICHECFLVQLEEYVRPEEIFDDYAYFSSYSDSWLQHSEAYTKLMIDRFGLDSGSLVIELASNDGYLLQYFVEKGIPTLGIEPAKNVAAVAQQKGVLTLVRFFNSQTARELVAAGHQPDLVLGNNVLAQVPDLNDFVRGMKILLKSDGVITMEFPHLLRLMEQSQFDTIYHEHFSYFSYMTSERIFSTHGLTLFDVEELPTHGGSLRIYARHTQDASKPISTRVENLRELEHRAHLNRLESYASFGEAVAEVKRKLLTFLIEAKREKKQVAGYGAPGKGNTLLNYCGIRTDLVSYTVDRNPHKHGRFLPGTHIPIFSPERIRQTRPDFVLIMPWNLSKEIVAQNSYIREWGGRFVVAIPELRVLE